MLLSECECPICLEILIKPVTLPGCDHELCMPCFEKHVRQTSWNCPVCRKWIGAAWARNAEKTNTLINFKRWNEIREHFSEFCEKRMRGEECDDLLQDMQDIHMPPRRHVIAQPGELRLEYQEQMRKAMLEYEKERKVEEELSRDLIENIKKEDEKRTAKMDFQRHMDKRIAEALLLEESDDELGVPGSDISLNSVHNTRALSRALSSRSSSRKSEKQPAKKGSRESSSSRSSSVVELGCSRTSSLMVVEDLTDNDDDVVTTHEKIKCCNKNLVNVKKEQETAQSESSSSRTASPFSVEGLRCGSVESDDSFRSDLNYFTPIDVSPKTPPKMMANGHFHDPKLVKSVPRNLSFTRPKADSGTSSSLPQSLSQKLLDLSRKSFSFFSTPKSSFSLESKGTQVNFSTSSGGVVPTSNRTKSQVHDDQQAGPSGYKGPVIQCVDPKVRKKLQVNKRKQSNSITKKPMQSEHTGEQNLPSDSESSKREETLILKRKRQTIAAVSKRLCFEYESSDGLHKHIRQLSVEPTSQSSCVYFADDDPVDTKPDREQMYKDHALAMRLQRQYELDVKLKMVNRRKGTEDAYSLRRRRFILPTQLSPARKIQGHKN